MRRFRSIVFTALWLVSAVALGAETRSIRTTVDGNGKTTSDPSVAFKAGARLTCMLAGTADRNNPGTCKANLSPGGLVVLKPGAEHVAASAGSVSLACGGTAPLSCELRIVD